METRTISVNLTLLGKESKQFNASPSDRIYFGRYPYKIKLDFNELITRAVQQFFNTDAGDDFAEQFKVGDDYYRSSRWAVDSKRWNEMCKIKDMILQIELWESERFYCNVDEGTISVYVKTKKHYSKIIKALSTHVVQVQGPWNKKHKELLLDPESVVVVRKKPYWGKFDIKVEIWPKGSQYNRWTGHSKRRALMHDALEFLSESMEPGAIRISPKKYYYSHLWTNDKDLTAVLPFLNIAYPNLRFTYYRCFYFK
jgi:hypothetical protein|tara:strand:- start:788 stop:1552 length:765 start_codon:yes stop_codon:yes gene_type:complete